MSERASPDPVAAPAAPLAPPAPAGGGLLGPPPPAPSRDRHGLPRRWARASGRPPLILAVSAGLVALAMVVPLVHLVARARGADDPLAVALGARTLELVWSTLRLALTCTLLAGALGFASAWLLERAALPGRRLLGVVAVLPLVVPTYVGALALEAAFGPRGLVVEVPGVVGFWGATAALTLATYPYVLLVCRASLSSVDPALEEVARTLGDGSGQVLRRVLLPLLRPALAAGSLLVFLYVLSDFGAVSILGYPTLTRAIFLEYRSSFDRAPAAVLGVVLVLLTLAALVVERRLRGRAAPLRAGAGRRPGSLVALGRWRWPAAVGVGTVAMAGAGVPVGVVAYWAVVGSSRGEAGAVLARAAITSVGLSASAAALAVALSLPVALLAVRHPSPFARVVESGAFAGYALPGLVIALALVFFAARYLPFVYETTLLVVAAYVIRFLPEALGPLRSSLSQVDPALEDAARSLGRSRAEAVVTVTLPLVRDGAVAGAGLVFLTAMKELPATLLLRPAGTDTLAVRIWTGASEGLYAQAAPAALLLVAVSALVLSPVLQVGRRVQAVVEQ